MKMRLLLLAALFISSAVATAQSLPKGINVTLDSYYAKKRKHFTSPHTLVRHTAREGEEFSEVYISVYNKSKEDQEIDLATITLAEQPLYLLLSERLKGEELATVQTIPTNTEVHYRLLFKTPTGSKPVHLSMDGMTPLVLQANYSSVPTYYNVDHYRVAGYSGAVYYTTVTEDGERLIKHTYQIKDKILLEEEVFDTEGRTKGITTSYYPDGTVKSEVYRINGNSYENELSYHPNGQIKAWSDFVQGQEHIHQGWQEDGTPLLEDGNGTLKRITAAGREEIRIIQDHKLLAAYEIKPDGTKLFTHAPVEASFIGGKNEFYRFVGMTLRYPQEARVMGEQGRVMVQFEVTKEGTLEYIQVVQRVSPTLDDEARRIISLATGWIPAEYQGEKVRFKMELPISFRLGL